MKKTIIGTQGQRLCANGPMFYGVDPGGENEGKFLITTTTNTTWLMTGIVPESNRQALCDRFEEFLDSDEARLDLRLEPLAQSEVKSETPQAWVKEFAESVNNPKPEGEWVRLDSLPIGSKFRFPSGQNNPVGVKTIKGRDREYTYTESEAVGGWLNYSPVVPIEQPQSETVKLGSLPVGAKFRIGNSPRVRTVKTKDNGVWIEEEAGFRHERQPVVLVSLPSEQAKDPDPLPVDSPPEEEVEIGSLSIGDAFVTSDDPTIRIIASKGHFVWFHNGGEPNNKQTNKGYWNERKVTPVMRC